MPVTDAVILQQLYILRGQVDLLITMAEGSQQADQVGCPHPEDKRRDTTTMGGEAQYMCLVCGATVKGRV